MIKVLLFAQLQEEMGASIVVDCAQCTVREVKEMIKQQYPTVDLQQVMTAVNEEFAFDDDVVKDGDVIAFLPPVSGG